MSYASEQAVLNAQWNTEAERQRPSVLYRPVIYRDGNQWCALYGPDIAIGVCGFGDTPAAAADAFDRAWHSERIEVVA